MQSCAELREHSCTGGLKRFNGYMKTSPFLLALVLSTSPLFAASPAPTAPATQAARVANGTPDDAEKLLASNPKVTVLDVRTPAEFASGHIKGAKNISSADPDFAAKVAALDKSQPVILHCAAGGRSAKVLPKVEAQNFPSVLHLDGGFNAWKEAGKPVAK